jgi:hypothetical protein
MQTAKAITATFRYEAVLWFIKEILMLLTFMLRSAIT